MIPSITAYRTTRLFRIASYTSALPYLLIRVVAPFFMVVLIKPLTLFHVAFLRTRPHACLLYMMWLIEFLLIEEIAFETDLMTTPLEAFTPSATPTP